MEYYSAIKSNKFDSAEMRWMNLKPAIQTAVSQIEKNKYPIFMHIYGIYKSNTDKPICRAQINMQMLTMDLWTQLRKGSVGQSERVVLK